MCCGFGSGRIYKIIQMSVADWTGFRVWWITVGRIMKTYATHLYFIRPMQSAWSFKNPSIFRVRGHRTPPFFIGFMVQAEQIFCENFNSKFDPVLELYDQHFAFRSHFHNVLQMQYIIKNVEETSV